MLSTSLESAYKQTDGHQRWKLQNSQTYPSDKCQEKSTCPTTFPLVPWKNNVLRIAQMLDTPQFRQMDTFPSDNHP